MSYVLGIESSCDDTSVAILSEDGHILSNVVSSQIEEHAPYMGVVPELASRSHLRNLPVVFEQALAEAAIPLHRISAVAVTKGPGLAGPLIVGINFAKALAFGLKLPLLGVNHIRGHVTGLFLEHQDIPMPALALIVSGGHTHLFQLDAQQSLTLLTKTRDDAAGEAFDKLSKMLGLGFPGGPKIDRLARSGNPRAFAFSMPRFNDGSYDYSFSGMKSAAARYIEAEPQAFATTDSRKTMDLCASFQAAIIRHLLDRVRRAVKSEQPASLLLGGGVACNSGLKTAFRELGQQSELPVYITSPKLSTDNAAMIAAEGLVLLNQGQISDLGITADIGMKPYDRVRLLGR